MANKISRKEFEKLCESEVWDSTERFNIKLEQLTGITAECYVGYSYFDSYGNYIGDSNDVTVEDLLRKANIDIVDT